MGVYIALDIGGTKMMAAAVDSSLNILRRYKELTPQSLEAGLDQMHALIEQAAAGEPILGIGMAIGGPMDHAAGKVSPLNQPEWRNVPIQQIIESRWGCPFYFGVDTDVAALGEYHIRGLDLERFFYLTISTGVGGGFLLNGQVYWGTNGKHPEVGHQGIAARGKYLDRARCECGNPDCLEALVSGTGIERMYDKPATELNTEEWDEVAYNLSQGLRNIMTMLSPDLIVLGGGVTTGGGKYFLHQTKQYLADTPLLVDRSEIRVSDLGYDTALLGAAFIARNHGSGL